MKTKVRVNNLGLSHQIRFNHQAELYGHLLLDHWSRLTDLLDIIF